ncbi:MAG: hypothetical protein R3A10_09405 [Caldilineaceae bacterium]
MPRTPTLLSGRILLWHASYDGAATAALEDILARFGELNPHTVVKVSGSMTKPP